MKSIRSRHEQGFSLLEVLVALLVTALGLLGLAALQAHTLRQNTHSQMRSQATFLAADLVESMRANPKGVANGAYALAFGGTATAGGVAGADLARWQTLLSDNLPAATASVRVDGNGYADITLRWQESGQAEPSEFSTNTRLGL